MPELDQQVRHPSISIRNIDNIFLLKYNLHKNIVKICFLANPEHIDYIVKFIIFFNTNQIIFSIRIDIVDCMIKCIFISLIYYL